MSCWRSSSSFPPRSLEARGYYTGSVQPSGMFGSWGCPGCHRGIDTLTAFCSCLCVCCDRCRRVRGVVRSSRGHGDASHEQVERARFLNESILWI